MPDDKQRKRPIGCCGTVAVVFILLVVGLILFPVFQKVRGSRFNSCIAHEKLLGIGLLSYAQDYDGRTPCPYRGAPQGWAGRINPYVSAVDTFRCPVQSRKQQGPLPFITMTFQEGDSTADNTALNPPAVAVSYAMNSNLQRGASGYPIARATDQQSTVMLFEVEGDTAQVQDQDEGTANYTQLPPGHCLSAAGDGVGSSPQWGWFGVGTSPIGYANSRHDSGANYAALDGHVKWLRPAQVSRGTTNPSSKGNQGNPAGAAAGAANAGYPLTFSTT